MIMPGEAAASPPPMSPPGARPKEPHKLRGAGCDVWGPQRLELAVALREALGETGDCGGTTGPHPWFLESGTLLGALRNGKFIHHDDDFDVAVVVPAGADAVATLEQLKAAIDARLPSPFATRLVTTYCDKIEVFNPEHGKYLLPGDRYNGADYHFVTVDIQAYRVADEDGRLVALYRAPGYPVPRHDPAVVFPVGSMVLEGERFPAPRDPTAFLEAVYGSLDPAAVYDPATGKYVLPSSS